MNQKKDLFMLLERVKCKHKCLYLFALVLVGIGFYLLAQFNLFAGDDFRYACTWDGGRINNLNEVFERELIEYNSWGGRFVIHSFVSAFAALWGMPLYEVCSSILFSLLIASLVFLCFRKNDTRMIPIVLLLMVFSNVTFKFFLGNIAFSANYLWSSAFVLFYVYLLEKTSKFIVKSRLTVVILLCYGIFTGALQETYSIGCSVASLLFLCVNWKQLPKTTKTLVIGFCIGASFLLLAPGNFGRQSGLNHSDSWVMEHFVYLCRVLFDGYVLFFLVFILGISWRKERQRTIDFCRENLFYFIAIIVSLGFAIVIFYAGDRQMLCPIFFSIILICRWIKEFNNRSLIHLLNPVAIISIILIMIAYIPIYQFRKEVYQAYDEMLDSADIATGTIVSKHFDRVSYMHRNWLQDKFSYTEMDDRMQMDAYSRWMSNSNDIKAITLRLPDSKDHIVSACNLENKVDDYIFHEVGNYYYILRIPFEEELKSFTIVANATRSELLMHIIKRSQSPMESKFQPDISSMSSFILGEYHYYIYMYREEIGVNSISICKG